MNKWERKHKFIDAKNFIRNKIVDYKINKFKPTNISPEKQFEDASQKFYSLPVRKINGKDYNYHDLREIYLNSQKFIPEYQFPEDEQALEEFKSKYSKDLKIVEYFIKLQGDYKDYQYQKDKIKFIEKFIDYDSRKLKILGQELCFFLDNWYNLWIQENDIYEWHNLSYESIKDYIYRATWYLAGSNSSWRKKLFKDEESLTKVDFKKISDAIAHYSYGSIEYDIDKMLGKNRAYINGIIAHEFGHLLQEIQANSFLPSINAHYEHLNMNDASVNKWGERIHEKESIILQNIVYDHFSEK